MANPFGKNKGAGGAGGLGNMAGLAQMVQQAQKHITEGAQKMEETLTEARIEGSAGGGMVKIVVDGKSQVVAVTIKPEAFEEGDAELLQDLVFTAMKQALEQAEELRNSEQEKLMPKGLNLPGLF